MSAPQFIYLSTQASVLGVGANRSIAIPELTICPFWKTFQIHAQKSKWRNFFLPCLLKLGGWNCQLAPPWNPSPIWKNCHVLLVYVCLPVGLPAWLWIDLFTFVICVFTYLSFFLCLIDSHLLVCLSTWSASNKTG